MTQTLNNFKVGDIVKHKIFGGGYRIEEIHLDGWCELALTEEDGVISYVGDMLINLERDNE